MLTVVCVNWRNYLGRGKEYTDKLRRAVGRNLTIPHEFVELTEKELGTDLKGWWAKIKLAEPGRFAGPVIYFDLDVAITSCIDGIAEIAAQDPAKVWMREDFSYPYSRPRALDPVTRALLGGPGCCNSSVMAWHGDALRPVWDAWQTRSQAFMTTMHGDQNVISNVLWPDRIGLLPDGMVQSYRYGMLRDGQKPAPVVVFHGNPKPHEIVSDWLSECWQ